MCHEDLDESRRAGRGPVAPAVFATSPFSQSITLTNPASPNRASRVFDRLHPRAWSGRHG